MSNNSNNNSISSDDKLVSNSSNNSTINNDKKNENTEIDLNILTMLSTIKKNEKIIISDEKIKIDDRIFQSIRRWFNNDNRYLSIMFLEDYLHRILKLLKTNFEQSTMDLLVESLEGLNNIKETYQNDILIKKRIEFIIIKLNRFINKKKK